MPKSILIGIAAGIASALLFASAGAGGMAGRMLLFFLAPLPTYLAGLGWGAVSAAIAALISSLGATAALGLGAGAVYLLGHGLPAVVLCYLALLSRPGATPEGPYDPKPASAIEWYPPGRLLAAAALIAGALAFVTVLMVGPDLETLRTLMREFLDNVILKQMPGIEAGKLGEPELKSLTELMVYALPAGSAVLWLTGFVLNLWLAGRVTQMSGRLERPWPDIPTMRFPARFALGLAVSLAGAWLLTGFPALLASGFAGAFFLAYVLMGLAIIHCVTRGVPGRPFILWGVYFTLIILNTWAAIAVAMIALLEPILPWRRPPEGYTRPPT